MGNITSNVILCPVCRYALRHLSELDERSKKTHEQAHYEMVTNFKAAAELGCRFCTVLWDRYNVTERKALLASDRVEGLGRATTFRLHRTGDLLVEIDGRVKEIDGERNSSPSPDDFSLNITLERWKTLHVKARFDDSVRFHFRPISNGTAGQMSSRDLPPSRTSLQNTASQETWNIARTWISECRSSHRECNEVHPEPWYPTRLLRFQAVDEHVRLIVTSEESCTGPCVTISHRWGGAHIYTLTRTTWSDLHKGVPIVTLPKAFQDAITICKRLDIHLLWIDSLCIFQDPDDLSDWFREAALMYQVYSRSFLNISTLAASDSNHSIFVDRGRDVLVQPRIGATIQKESHERWVEYQVEQNGLFRDEVLCAPLNLRGWVLQERLLCPRVLHFGRQQIFWECHERYASEAYPDKLPAVMTGDREGLRGPHSRLGLYWKETSSQTRSLDVHFEHRLRFRMAEAYSRCSLTKPEDKLIALSGLARRTAAFLEDEYVVGLWRRSLAQDLLWRVAFRISKYMTLQDSRRPSEYRAPTFSWASVDGMVEWKNYREQGCPLIEVIDVNLEYATSDRLGRVTSGSILLKGQLQRLRVVQDPDVSSNRLLIVNGVVARCHGRLHVARIYLDEHPDYFDPVTAEQGTLYSVPALTFDLFLACLPLQCVDEGRGIFRRFGLATAVDGPELKNIMGSGCEIEDEFPCITYDEGWHTFRLI